MKIKIFFIAILCFCCSTLLFAQQERNSTLISAEKNGWTYEIRAGIALGGASPIPLPRQIRKIESYSPKLNGVVEGVATYWLDGNKSNWGFSTGVRIEERGMETQARVKNYSTQIIRDGSKVSGYYTGLVKTQYNSTFITLPITANYRFDSKGKVRAGLFVSYRMDGNFEGSVSDGYLREDTPVGQKIPFDGDATASYDFSENLRRFAWGAQIGGSWRAFKHFTVNADLTYNINGIFKKDFKTISFKLHPIYVNLGFGYHF